MLKYIRLILILLVLTHIAGAQDLIIFSNVDEILAKVTIIEEEVINYKKFNNLSGPSYMADMSKLYMIKFENGTKEVFVE